MKRFKDLFKESAPAQDYKSDEDNENEIAGDGYKYRSSGEQKFADMMVALSKKNGVNYKYELVDPQMKNIFNGNVKKNDQHNPADGMKDEKGEKKPLKTYKDLFKTAPRKEPKGQGFKEEVEHIAVNEKIKFPFSSGQTIDMKSRDKTRLGKNDAAALNKMIGALSGSNKKRALDKVEKDMDSFKDILTFAKGV